MGSCRQFLSVGSIPPNATIALWGKGAFGSDMRDCLAERRPDVHVVCFIDSFEAGRFQGIPVLTPDQILEKIDTFDLLFITSHFHEDIFKSMDLRLSVKAVVAKKGILTQWHHAKGEGTMFHSSLVELSRSCDMSCDFCNQQKMSSTKGLMDIEKYAEMMHQIAAGNWTNKVTLAGLGEPMCHPKVMEAVSIGKKEGLSMGICTNALLLTPEKLINLEKRGLDTLQISLHTLTERSYTLRNSKNGMSFVQWYGKILKCLETHAKHAMSMNIQIRLMLAFPERIATQLWKLRELEEDTINMNSISQRFLEELKSIASKTGQPYDFSPERFQEAVTTVRDTRCSLNINDILPNVDLQFTELLACSPEDMAVLAPKNVKKFKYEYPDKMYCSNPMPLVIYNGDVFPCCGIPLSEKTALQLKIGNCFETSFDDCLKGDKYQHFYDLNMKRELDWSPCRKCMASYRPV